MVVLASFVMCGCVCVFCNVRVFGKCVLVFSMFCIVCDVFFIVSFMYIYIYIISFVWTTATY